MTAPPARLPTLAVQPLSGATRRPDHCALDTLVTISDPDSVGYQQLELWDSFGGTCAADSS